MLLEFNATDIATLSTSRLIPFERQNAPADLRLPNESYFNSTTSLPPGLQALFPSIPDFSPAAKQFLAAIGVRDSPSPLEIANRLVADPERFLELCNPENYLDSKCAADFPPLTHFFTSLTYAILSSPIDRSQLQLITCLHQE